MSAEATSLPFPSVEVYSPSSPGARSAVGEPVFVPKAGGAAEDSGWLLAMVYDPDEDKSRLETLDARAIGDGPVTYCWFEQAVPLGFLRCKP